MIRKRGKLCPNSYPTTQYTLEGKFIKDWESISDIRRELGYDVSSIARVRKGQVKSAYGYLWKPTPKKENSRI